MLCLVLLIPPGCRPHGDKTIMVYAGRGLQAPVEEIAGLFCKAHPGVKVDVVYGGTITLFNTLVQTQKGDVFIVGDSLTMERGRRLVVYSRVVARHAPVVALARDNPARIGSFEDLARPGVRLAVGNAGMCVLGRVAGKIFSGSDIGKRIEKNVLMRAPDSLELMRLLSEGEVDAAVIWKDMLLWPGARGLFAIEIPGGLDLAEDVQVAVLATSSDEALARAFADFVAREGRRVFMMRGFSPVTGE